MKSSRIFPTVFLTGLLLFALAGCLNKKVATTIQGVTQGTHYKVIVRDTRPREDLRQPIDSLLGLIERSMSLYDRNSLISRLNRNETDSVDVFIARCIELAEGVSRRTDGLYDITVKPLFEAWGFLGRQPGGIPNVDSLLQYVGYEKIAVENGRLVKSSPFVQIDLNSVAQGLTADLVGELLKAHGIRNYLVEVGGGEIFCRGRKTLWRPWRIGIETPSEGNITAGGDLYAVMKISGQGIATSGNYRKFRQLPDGQKVVHTLNPKTGFSEVSNLLSATVVAENSATADAYGTALMVLGLERSKELLGSTPGIAGYLIYTDDSGAYRTWISPSLESKITPVDRDPGPPQAMK